MEAGPGGGWGDPTWGWLLHPRPGRGGELWLGQTGPEPRSSAAATPAWTESCTPTFLGGSPDPKMTVFEDRAFQRLTRLNEVLREGPNPTGLVSSQKRKKHQDCAQAGQSWVRTQ